jgi:lysophospholipase L1-like esterase
MTATQEKKPRNALPNGDFASSLAGWTVEGAVELATAGSGGIRIGPGKGAVRQRYTISGLRIVYFGATLRADPETVSGIVRVECYDVRNRRVMELRAGLDKKKAAGSGEAGIYFKTHAHTAAIVVSIEKESETPGYLYATSAILTDFDEERKAHRPECDLNQYMLPFWKGNTVHDETVLLLSESGKPARGRLMYTPRRILSVRDYGHRGLYQAGRDYTMEGRNITRVPSSTMPYRRDTDFETGDLKWYSLTGKHIVVSYVRDGKWQGPVPTYQGDSLPRTMSKLTGRAPLTIAATGDSITLGTGTSGDSGILPYMPTWAYLFVHRLKQIYRHNAIRLYNTALGGMTSDWGNETATGAVASLDPDLVLIAFGMNDFWWMPEEHFRRNIQAIIRQVRARKPTTEFILIASMRFDPAYTKDPQYRGRVASYISALRSLTGPGIGLLDMDAISGALITAKKPKDLVSDPLHPNDFLARWYAQGLVALLDRSASATSFPSIRRSQTRL